MSGTAGYRPGLDGLRAVAVAAVVVFHLGLLPGGNLGVDLFFVISGWLITWKLLEERTPLRRFWAARARRLMPASLCVLLVVAVLWPLLGIQVTTLRHDVLWAAVWLSNWGTIAVGGDYWARFGAPSPITHFWSLAVEEQYYAVWPLLLVGILALTRRRSAVGGVALVLAAASVAWMAASYDPADATRTYLDTFARAHTLLIGAAAAALTTVGADGRLRGGRLARRAAVPAAAAMVVVVVMADATSEWLFRWGFPLFAVLGAVVVVAAADGAGAGALASRPARWVADRSYGLYLWHWPVFLLLDPQRLGVDSTGPGAALVDVARVAVAVLVADISLRSLERPIRAGRWLPSWKGGLATAGAMVAVAAVAVAVVPGPPATASTGIVLLAPPAPPSASPSAPSSGDAGATDAGPAPEVIGGGRAGEGTGVGDSAGDDSNVATLAETEPADGDATRQQVRTTAPTEDSGPVRALVVGDSTAVALSEALLAYAGEHPDELVAGSAAFPGCGLSSADDGRLHEFTDVDGDRELIDLSGCVMQWRDSIARIGGAEQIDVVVVEIGPWDAVDIHLADGRVVSVADPVGRGLVESAYGRFAEEIRRAGAAVLWVRPADAHLGWGEFEDPVNDPARWSALRAIVDGLDVVQIDLPSWLSAHGLDDEEGRPDGIHLAPEVNERFVAELVAPWLVLVGGAAGRS